MRTGRFAMVSGATIALATGVSAARADVFGPEWVEDTDAGSLPGDAQNTVGEGNMAGIRGSLFSDINPGTDTEDMFFISITDVKNFSATTFNPGFAEFDTQLWLFRINGIGLLGNDEGSDEGKGQGQSFLGPISNDGSGVRVTRPGRYLLAITAFNNDPFSDGGFIFNQASRFEISGNDGQGGDLPIIGWQDNSGNPGNERQYRIFLTGASFGSLPSPGALAMLGMAALIGPRRRRA